MSRFSLEHIETLSTKLRLDAGFNDSEPINAKTLLKQLGILTMYKPMSDKSCGLSLKSDVDEYKFILINSNNARGRQHFTIGHELFHLYFDNDPKPHICLTESGNRNSAEINADNFASALLMPKEGIIKHISNEEIKSSNISMATILKLQQLFSVSHQALVYRLRHLNLINEKKLEQLLNCTIKKVAKEYGYDLSLYEKGNENLIIGDFGEKAKILFDREKISEGHYLELLNKISIQ
jgi:Zn-dependent peptidase ImmA (M78 family)